MIHNIHTNGASIFFIRIYIRAGRGICCHNYHDLEELLFLSSP